MRTKLVRRCMLGAAITAALAVAAARFTDASEHDTARSTPPEPVASGPLDEGSVRALMAAGRAASLCDRLAPRFCEILETELREQNEALGGLACAIVAEEARVSETLRRRGDRCFPRTHDFERPSANQGKVLAESVPSGDVEYLAVLWSEWPRLRQLHEDRVALVTKQRAFAGDWIKEQFERHGLALFRR